MTIDAAFKALGCASIANAHAKSPVELARPEAEKKARAAARSAFDTGSPDRHDYRDALRAYAEGNNLKHGDRQSILPTEAPGKVVPGLARAARSSKGLLKEDEPNRAHPQPEEQ